MTDITELAQRLKLEVHRAVSNFNPQMNIKTRDLKELVEALEKAQKRISQLESRTVKLPPKVDSSNVPFAGYAWNCCLDEVEKRLAAAGIKVEAE
ncbi:Uncharacterised protein [Klebsiella pneumoniae]|nr:hypothetical protein L477_00258 [Klebsiella pneumoniae BIDMC 40]KMK47892.1 hypothetical protein ABW15_13305 [Klebsiella pneumoniae]SLV42188.1 Uncharacterised protein [Klebsiella pneumoniae]SLV76888.1 Uncharacterised protein [Klebsiella pneumoniae]SLX63435.1 Uncharacterised protein [Klebsiella pneumoniae]